MKLKAGLGIRDLVFCDSCRLMWSAPDIDSEGPEYQDHECPRCYSKKLSWEPAR